MRVLSSSILLGVLVVSCREDSLLPEGCRPGAVQQCAGKGACEGVQVCSDDGNQWGECLCDQGGRGQAGNGSGGRDGSSEAGAASEPADSAAAGSPRDRPTSTAAAGSPGEGGSSGGSVGPGAVSSTAGVPPLGGRAGVSAGEGGAAGTPRGIAGDGGAADRTEPGSTGGTPREAGGAGGTSGSGSSPGAGGTGGAQSAGGTPSGGASTGVAANGGDAGPGVIGTGGGDAGSGVIGTGGGDAGSGVIGTGGSGATGGSGGGSGATSAAAGAAGFAAGGTAGSAGAEAGAGGIPGGSGGAGGTVAEPLAIVEGTILAEGNAFGIQGPVFTYGDGTSLIRPACGEEGDPCFDDFSGTEDLCVDGTVTYATCDYYYEYCDFDLYWGAGLGINLNQSGDDDPEPFRALDRGITGFRFDFDNVWGSEIRFQFKIAGENTAYCIVLEEGEREIRFDDVRRNCWDPGGDHLTDSQVNNLEGIQWAIPTRLDYETDFDFCVSAITPLTD